MTVSEVWQKLRTVVPQKAGVKMTPQMSHVGAGDGEFVFIPRSVPDKAVALLKEAVAEVQKGDKVDVTKLEAFRGLLKRKQELIGDQSKLADVIRAMEAQDYKYWRRYRRGRKEMGKHRQEIPRQRDPRRPLGDGRFALLLRQGTRLGKIGYGRLLLGEASGSIHQAGGSWPVSGGPLL